MLKLFAKTEKENSTKKLNFITVTSHRLYSAKEANVKASLMMSFRETNRTPGKRVTLETIP